MRHPVFLALISAACVAASCSDQPHYLDRIHNACETVSIASSSSTSQHAPKATARGMFDSIWEKLGLSEEQKEPVLLTKPVKRRIVARQLLEHDYQQPVRKIDRRGMAIDTDKQPALDVGALAQALGQNLQKGMLLDLVSLPEKRQIKAQAPITAFSEPGKPSPVQIDLRVESTSEPKTTLKKSKRGHSHRSRGKRGHTGGYYRWD